MGVEWLTGKTCTRVFQHYRENFTFEFGEGALAADGLWRILMGGKVILTSRDHGQKFGFPEPVDACGSASSELRGRRVAQVRVVEPSADLVIEFEGQRTLELITDTSGYEPWNLVAPGVHLVARCGGGVTDFGAETQARRRAGRKRST